MPRHAVDDLLLPDLDTAQTVRVGYSNPFEDNEPMFHVRVSVLADPTPTAISSAADPPRSRYIDPAELGSESPSGLITAPMVRSSFRSVFAFGLLLIAVSMASVCVGLYLGR